MGIEDELRSEVERQAGHWSTLGITFEVEQSPRGRSKSATWVVLGGPAGAGQLTVWSSREAEEELNSHDGEVIGGTHYDDLAKDQIVPALGRLALFVKGA